ncbi:MAG: tetratricopeptide repeat protein, partial [Nannocystaceae bacterium]
MTHEVLGRGAAPRGGLSFARWLAALALVAGCSTSVTPAMTAGEGGGPGDPVDDGGEHGPEVGPPDVPLPAEAVTYADELARVDARIAAIEARAEVTGPSWLTLETLAGAQQERAQLTGDYDDYAAAEATLAEAFALAGGETGPWMTRARLHFTLHRLDAAIADLDKMSERFFIDDRQQAAIDGLRADIAFQRGDYGVALAEFLRIADAKPNVTSLARLATYRWKTGDFDGADALYKRALESYDGTAAQPRAWLRLMRGLLDLDRGRYHEAYAHYQYAEAELSGFWLIEEHIAE